MGQLDGKVVIVSGVGPGLGAQVATRAAAAGAAVVLGARREEQLREIAGRIEAEGGRVAWAPCDVTSDADCAALAATAVERFGGIDCLVNNAFASGPHDVPIEDSDFDAWQVAFDVNLFGSLRMSRALLPAMRQRGGGSIVFVGSQIVRRVFAGRGPYASSKGALLIAAKVLAKEVGPSNIRVNTVVPGRMAGPSLYRSYERRAVANGTSLEHEMQVGLATMALPTFPTDGDCAGAVLFLASDWSAAMTGQSFDVNGGETFH